MSAPSAVTLIPSLASCSAVAAPADTASTFDVAKVEHVGRGSRLSTTSMITVKAVVVNRSAWSLSPTENRSRLGWPDRAVAVIVHAADNAEVRRDSGCAATTRVVG